VFPNFLQSKFIFRIFSLLFLTGLVFSLFACSNAKKSSNSKTVTVAGSTTILPISEHWAHLFFQKYGIRVIVQGGGSTHGIDLVRTGKVQIGASSRDLSLHEKEEIKIIPICRDLLAVIVNPSNPVKNISLENLSKIFSGEITNWKELGGKNLKIQVINRESGSGTRSTFQEKVMCSKTKSCKRFLLNSLVMNSNYEVRKSVQSAENSISYLSLSFLSEKVVKSVLIDKQDFRDPSYKLYRELYYLVHKNKETPENTKKYLEFVKSPEAQKELVKEGFRSYY